MRLSWQPGSLRRQNQPIRIYTGLNRHLIGSNLDANLRPCATGDNGFMEPKGEGLSPTDKIGTGFRLGFRYAWRTYVCRQGNDSGSIEGELQAMGTTNGRIDRLP